MMATKGKNSNKRRNLERSTYRDLETNGFVQITHLVHKIIDSLISFVINNLQLITVETFMVSCYVIELLMLVVIFNL